MDRQRIDKWLWHARVVRTRSAAAALANSGQVRVNGVRIDAASRVVRPGDVVTLVLSRALVLKVAGFSGRRGSAEAARMLYEDLQPRMATPGPTVVPEPAGPAPEGRPDKRDRRSIQRLKRESLA